MMKLEENCEAARAAETLVRFQNLPTLLRGNRRLQRLAMELSSQTSSYRSCLQTSRKCAAASRRPGRPASEELFVRFLLRLGTDGSATWRILNAQENWKHPLPRISLALASWTHPFLAA